MAPANCYRFALVAAVVSNVIAKSKIIAVEPLTEPNRRCKNKERCSYVANPDRASSLLQRRSLRTLDFKGNKTLTHVALAKRAAASESKYDSWWHKAAAFQTIAITELSLTELYDYLDTLEKYGTRVISFNVAYYNGPMSMWSGLAMNDPYRVNTVFGNDKETAEKEFDKFIETAHKKGMRVISWMNPSYWWTGSEYVKQAERDMKSVGAHQDWKSKLPSKSPARWFQWSTQRASKGKPSDDKATANYPGVVLNWVWDEDAGYSYRAHWADQPMVDFNSPEFQEEWRQILKYWITERHLDGFIYDAPDRYLGTESGALEPRFYTEQGITTGQFKRVITGPGHELNSQFMQIAEAYGDQEEMVHFGLNAVLQSGWDVRFNAWGDIVEGIKKKDGDQIENAFTEYDRLLRTNKNNDYAGILWQRHHNLPFGENQPAKNALARAISVAGGYLAAVEDPGTAFEWWESDSNQRWWEKDPYTGTEEMLHYLANAMDNCAAFAHGTQRERLSLEGNSGEGLRGGTSGGICNTNAQACGTGGCHTCGERIEWLKSSAGGGLSDSDAREHVAREFPQACGGCHTQSLLATTSNELYAVLRYISGGAVGFAVFNLEGSATKAVMQVPASLQGQTVADCASPTHEFKMPATYQVDIPAYGFKMIGVATGHQDQNPAHRRRIKQNPVEQEASSESFLR